VDPRTSRDGVPLCARHADGTTPPIGWTMNDLRTTSGVINGANTVADAEGGITAAPPRVRPERNDQRGGTNGKMSQRQSIVERARREASELQDEIDATVLDETAETPNDGDQLKLLDDETRERVVNAKLAERASRRGHNDKGPNSRPSRRRAAAESPSSREEGFPWTFHLDDDQEPEELHASTPLLSRAFRATTG